MPFSAQRLHVLDERCMLAPAGELAYNDAPWVPAQQDLRFVHPKLSNQARGCTFNHSLMKVYTKFVELASRMQAALSCMYVLPQERAVLELLGREDVACKVMCLPRGWFWQVAEKLGVGSLRRHMLAESADSMHLGLHSSSAAEAFGQVSLCVQPCSALRTAPCSCQHVTAGRSCLSGACISSALLWQRLMLR